MTGGSSGDFREWDDWSYLRRGWFIVIIAVAVFLLGYGYYLVAADHDWLGWLPLAWSAGWLTWQYFMWRQLLRQRAGGG